MTFEERLMVKCLFDAHRIICNDTWEETFKVPIDNNNALPIAIELFRVRHNEYLSADRSNEVQQRLLTDPDGGVVS